MQIPAGAFGLFHTTACGPSGPSGRALPPCALTEPRRAFFFPVGFLEIAVTDSEMLRLGLATNPVAVGFGFPKSHEKEPKTPISAAPPAL